MLIVAVLIGLFLLATVIQFLQLRLNAHPSERVVHHRIVEVDARDSSVDIKKNANKLWKEIEGEVDGVHKGAVKPANKHDAVIRALGEEVPADE